MMATADATRVEQLNDSLGVTLDPQVCQLALTHRSFAYENDGVATNERLEFLGDAILGVAVTDYLFHRFPELPEGDLAKLRSALVSTRALARIGRKLAIGSHIRLGEGEIRSGGSDKDSILADTMESLFGAVYLSAGMEQAHACVLRLVTPLLGDADAMTAGKDWKTTVQEIAAARSLGDVVYDVSHTGPDHQRVFTAVLRIDENPWGSGSGSSKKNAERLAAQEAVQKLITGNSSNALDLLDVVLDKYQTQDMERVPYELR